MRSRDLARQGGPPDGQTWGKGEEPLPARRFCTDELYCYGQIGRRISLVAPLYILIITSHMKCMRPARSSLAEACGHSVMIQLRSMDRQQTTADKINDSRRKFWGMCSEGLLQL